MNLLDRLRGKKKTKREKLKDAASEKIHGIADTLDDIIAESRKSAPKNAKQAQKELKKVQKQAQKGAESARERASDLAGTVSERRHDVSDYASVLAAALQERATEGRERAADGAALVGEEATAKGAAALAALGALTANWDEVRSALEKELEHLSRSDDHDERKKEASRRHKKPRKYPGLWINLLRLGLGLLFVERLRSRDMAAYIDHGAGDQMRQAAAGHPIASYKELLDNLLIPNASLAALAFVAAEVLTALGLMTGMNRRLAALLGLALTANDLMAEYDNEEKRGQNLVLALAQLLVLRTG